MEMNIDFWESRDYLRVYFPPAGTSRWIGRLLQPAFVYEGHRLNEGCLLRRRIQPLPCHR